MIIAIKHVHVMPPIILMYFLPIKNSVKKTIHFQHPLWYKGDNFCNFSILVDL